MQFTVNSHGIDINSEKTKPYNINAQWEDGINENKFLLIYSC